MDFFIAGTETTGGTLAWATLYMILHPETQTKVQQELDSILEGKDAMIEDMKRYTTFFIHNVRNDCINL